MFRREVDVFLLGTAMAATLLQSQGPNPRFSGRRLRHPASLGPGEKASGGVNRKPLADSSSACVTEMRQEPPRFSLSSTAKGLSGWSSSTGGSKATPGARG